MSRLHHFAFDVQVLLLLVSDVHERREDAEQDYVRHVKTIVTSMADQDVLRCLGDNIYKV